MSPLPHCLLAPIWRAAPLVLVEGAGEGQEGVSVVGVVPPQQDRDRTRPRHPVLELERVDGEPLDLSLELFLTLELNILSVHSVSGTPRHHTDGMRRRLNVK